MKKCLGCFCVVVVVAVVLSVIMVDGKLFQDSNNLWNQDISTWTVSPNSTGIIAFLEGSGGWDGSNGGMRIDFSMYVNFVDANTQWVEIYPNATGYNYAECDDIAGLKFPIPSQGAVEGGTLSGNFTCNNQANDCHLLVVDQSTGMLYESYHSNFVNGKLQSACVVQWNLCYAYGLSGRGEQCTSTDAGGLAVAPGVVQLNEIANGTLDHALRFILYNGQIGKGPDQGAGNTEQYIHPANHLGGPQSTNPLAPMYGTRFRLKQSFNTTGFPPQVELIANALKQHGMILTDGDGTPAFGLCFENDAFTALNWYNDWKIYQHTLRDYGFTVASFEVVEQPDYPTVITYTGNCSPLPVPTTACSISTGSTGSPTTSSPSSSGGDGSSGSGGGGQNDAASLSSVVGEAMKEVLML